RPAPVTMATWPSSSLFVLISLVLDPGANPENCAWAHPAVDEAAVVADLEPFALDGLHEVQVLAALHLAQHDIADPDPGVVHRRPGATRARRAAPRHGSAARSELNRFPPLQALDVAIRPAHRSSSPLGATLAPEGRRVEPRRQAEAR